MVFQVRHDLDDAFLGGVREGFHEVRAAERVRDPGDAGLVGEDLLGAQGERRRLLAGQRERLVPGRREHRLDAAQHRGHRLVRHPDRVVLRLRRVQEAPPATQPKRNIDALSVLAPYRSRTMVAQRLRPARYLAISSKKSPWV